VIGDEDALGNFGATNDDVLFVDPLNRLVAVEGARDERGLASRNVIDDGVTIGVLRGHK
jgi:hypothetical protein